MSFVWKCFPLFGLSLFFLTLYSFLKRWKSSSYSFSFIPFMLSTFCIKGESVEVLWRFLQKVLLFELLLSCWWNELATEIQGSSQGVVLWCPRSLPLTWNIFTCPFPNHMYWKWSSKPSFVGYRQKCHQRSGSNSTISCRFQTLSDMLFIYSHIYACDKWYSRA
jgi:hypothetical protein